MPHCSEIYVFILNAIYTLYSGKGEPCNLQRKEDKLLKFHKTVIDLFLSFDSDLKFMYFYMDIYLI